MKEWLAKFQWCVKIKLPEELDNKQNREDSLVFLRTEFYSALRNLSYEEFIKVLEIEEIE